MSEINSRLAVLDGVIILKSSKVNNKFIELSSYCLSNAKSSLSLNKENLKCLISCLENISDQIED